MSEHPYYSQGNEETYILDAVKHIEGGRFLDIGAWSPTHFSNTRRLWEMGWGGVMIEPSPVPMHGLVQAYGNDPKITLVQAAVGVDHQLIKLYVTQDALSTTSEAAFVRWSGEGGYYGSLEVPQITVADIFLRFDGGFEFISIDTEGSSVEVLKAVFALGVRPTCICFEHDKRFVESFAMLESAGYRLVMENDNNRIIVRNA
jgi:FkbM family methyltransferase